MSVPRFFNVIQENYSYQNNITKKIQERETYEDFAARCKEKFNIQKTEHVALVLEDGSEFDEEYYPYLGSGEKIYIRRNHVQSDLISKCVDFISNIINKEPNISQKLHDIITQSDKSSNLSELMNLLAKSTDKVDVSCRDEDPNWFKGVQSNMKTKEDVLRGSAECRVRSYYSKVQKELRLMIEESDEEDTKNDNLKIAIEDLLLKFKSKLSLSKYNQSYFDRKCIDSDERLCDPSGTFPCGGEYDKPHCLCKHFINPYASREDRIIFSTWNLDHMIEKSRTVIPRLKKLLQSSSEINWHYFYDLLFTKYSNCQIIKSTSHSNTPKAFNLRNDDVGIDCTDAKRIGVVSDISSLYPNYPVHWKGNLKLVHIACHIKLPHTVTCDERYVIIPAKNDRNEVNENKRKLDCDTQDGVHFKISKKSYS